MVQIYPQYNLVLVFPSILVHGNVFKKTALRKHAR